MKLIKCPKCGEMYSDSYKTCPFCQEDEALKGRSAAPHRKVTKHRRAPSILGPAMVLVVVLAAVLVGVLLFGGKGSANKPADKPTVEEPTPTPTEPLTLDQTTLNMNQGETATLTVTGAENVLWTSSDPNVATVDDSGTVTAGRSRHGHHHRHHRRRLPVCRLHRPGSHPPAAGTAQGGAGPALHLSGQGRDHL